MLLDIWTFGENAEIIGYAADQTNKKIIIKKELYFQTLSIISNSDMETKTKNNLFHDVTFEGDFLLV